MTSRRGAVTRVLVAGLIALAITAGCAARDGGNQPAAARTAQEAVGPREAPLLSPAAVPGLAVTTRSLPASALAKDAPALDLTAELSRDAYAGGRERTFQGPSRHLTLVTSRSLVFAGAPGATAFVAYVRANSNAWFGLTTEVTALASAGRSGWMFRPPECACHLANPVLVGVVRDGRRVTWLAINGPAATARVLGDLLSPQLSTPS